MPSHKLRHAVAKWSRKSHAWGAFIVSLPLICIIGTGLVLQLKKDSAWVQPPTARGQGGDPSISFGEILEAASGVPEARVSSWDDVDRLDVRPDKGVVKVRAKSRWEVQVDTATGEVVQVAYRRSDLIETIHDGSFFGDWVKLWIFFPTAAVLLGLWITGVYLFVQPRLARARGRRKKRRAAASRG